MTSLRGWLVLESGEVFPGRWGGGCERAGEVVFNTSHSGYEEMATDPSYFNQILVLTAPMQGNYGVSKDFWESRRLWIQGFVCLENQTSSRDTSWADRLKEYDIPLLTEVNTRKLVLHLRSKGTSWGALVQAESEDQARSKAQEFIEAHKKGDLDWVHAVSRSQVEDFVGERPQGPKIAVLDLGCKQNSIRELQKRSKEVRVFPVRTSAEEIKAWKPDGILLSNGPGDPAQVQQVVETVRSLLGWRFIFGICMGHQILGQALGAKTFRLKFGHRGSNHPIQDRLLGRIYMTSQNHSYALVEDSLPTGVQVTHTNLNDGTISGIYYPEQKCMSVQFHPESHPGPHEAVELFDFFIKQIQ